ncbi:3'-5' exonuclease [Rhizobium grahamii]|uniref:DNA polymerase III subunit epsilon n=1 Tax=Rhizobium grahamii CCGE 502 TaxID=990285 RepID=S3HUZ3_9HYPH|nr:3'-5' exonuclease [Rhizobium grahamii]EPE97006.1 DNA polymerase III subunit epsilon [Rhizobium grahamii CCGE 502]
MANQLEMFAAIPVAARAEAVKPRAIRKNLRTAPEEMARSLEATGDYKILRRLPARPVVTERKADFTRVGVIVDTETTGLDHRKDEIIEIGAVAFSFDDNGTIGDVIDVYGGLQEPQAPIPADITRLTGITDEMVAGQQIDIAALRRIVETADLVIAHNAGFDRPFCEAFSPLFVNKAWACSVKEIDWSLRGFEGTKLGYLIGQAGYFHEGHRAVDDCFALLEVLDHQKDESDRPFAELHRAAQRSRVRLFAEHSPFDMKDHLKARGYRWSDGTDGRPRSWWIELDEDALDEERHFLRTEIYRWDEADPPVQHLTALERFRA